MFPQTSKDARNLSFFYTNAVRPLFFVVLWIATPSQSQAQKPTPVRRRFRSRDLRRAPQCRQGRQLSARGLQPQRLDQPASPVRPPCGIGDFDQWVLQQGPQGLVFFQGLKLFPGLAMILWLWLITANVLIRRDSFLVAILQSLPQTFRRLQSWRALLKVDKGFNFKWSTAGISP